MPTPAPSTSSYPNWKAPAEDGATIVWPQPQQLLRDTVENQTRLSGSSIRIQNVPFSEIRKRQREQFGYTDDARPLLANGHQAELHHAGVWVKNVLVDVAARKLGGEAYHLAVDTDEPKHLVLRWPGGAEPLTDDPNATSAAWSALVRPPTPQYLRRAINTFANAATKWDFEPSIGPFFESMTRASSGDANLPTALTNSIHDLERSLGLTHRANVMSPVWQGKPYLLFVHHLLAHAGDLAANYNAALAEYRVANGIKTPGRPMPDLKVATDRCEAPFWLDALDSGERSRACVARIGNAWALKSPSGAKFELDPSKDGWKAAAQLAEFLKSQTLRLSPRAIVLTMYVRLFLADQFVHGIGGGRYDQVTDRVIARHFKLEPPKFSVTTATLYFPEAVGRSRACLPCIVQDGHRLKHSLLGDEKMRMVEQIESLPRHSSSRREVFSQMHTALRNAGVTNPAIQRWETHLREAESQHREEQSLFDRELFFAIQPRERLEGMIGKYTSLFA